MTEAERAIQRRTLFACALAFIVGVLIQPLLPKAHGAQIANLQEQLEKGLQARYNREFLFVRRVVTMVEKEQLPLSLVRGTFNWTREKHKKYPFPYFERALKIRARRIGIVVR